MLTLIAMTQRNPVIPSELMITTTPTSKKDTSRLYIINNIIKLFINNSINSNSNNSSNSSSNSSSNNIIKLFINNTINNIINNITPPRNLTESYHRIKHLTTPLTNFLFHPISFPLYNGGIRGFVLCLFPSFILCLTNPEKIYITNRK